MFYIKFHGDIPGDIPLEASCSCTTPRDHVGATWPIMHLSKYHLFRIIVIATLSLSITICSSLAPRDWSIIKEDAS